MQYQRTQLDLHHGSFRVRGDVLEILPAYEEAGHPGRVLRRRDRAHQPLRRAARRGLRGGRPHRGLPQDPLRDAAGQAGAGDRRHQGRAGRAAGRARGAGQAARAPAPRAAHPLRPRDAAGDRLLPRHRELLAPPLRPRRRASRRRPCSTTSPRTSCWWSTRATRPSRRCAACTTATARASRRWSISASACPRRSTTARSPSRSSTPASASGSTSRRRRRPGSWSAPAA